LEGLVGVGAEAHRNQPPLYLPETPLEEERFPILGMTAGILGLLEAVEVCKVITSLGIPLVGRVLHLGLENMIVQKFKVEKQTNCSVCYSL
jgi:adenylyltransferase/sulfurtransferase